MEIIAERTFQCAYRGGLIGRRCMCPLEIVAWIPCIGQDVRRGILAFGILAGAGIGGALGAAWGAGEKVINARCGDRQKPQEQGHELPRFNPPAITIPSQAVIRPRLPIERRPTLHEGVSLHPSS